MQKQQQKVVKTKIDLTKKPFICTLNKLLLNKFIKLLKEVLS
jgi:hypothetical protein